ncbi:MAG TPA: FHA domain-containing protein [Vicinamibacteria bacterium]|nr:FHA domain-containing protein [Vicinamibacteria bacterium]
MKVCRLPLIGLALLATPVGAEPPPPVVVALVFDTSGSLRPADVEAARELSTGLLKALPPGSQAAVLAFADQSQLLLPRTADLAAIETAVSSLRPTGRTTALYDALYDASRYLRDAEASQRAVVLLTDGLDEGSALSVEDGLKVAQETHIPVFCVGVGKVQERVLRRVAKLTSGEYVPIAETTGGSLAARILDVTKATAAETAAVSKPKGALAGPAAAPSPVAAQPETPAPARSSSTLLAGALLVLAAALAGTVLFARARRSAAVAAPLPLPPPSAPRTAPREDETVAADVPATVFARMNLGEEAVERTLFLRERPVLEITAGPGRGRVFPLSPESATSLGRARANDIALEDEAVSGQHCRVRPEEGGFVLHDLGSTNGTRVNERRVSRHGLQDGDVIRVGDTSLRFKLTQGR